MIYAVPAPGAVVARTDVETFAATPDADAREVAAAADDVVAAFALLVGLSVHDPFCSTTSLRCTLRCPFIVHNMATAILTKKGAETGETLIGHADFQLGDDVARKMHYGHVRFTCLRLRNCR